MKCAACNDKGTIYRPVRQIVQEVVRVSERVGGHLFETKETVITESGGIDACPVCTAKAEAEWRCREHPRAAIKEVA